MAIVNFTPSTHRSIFLLSLQHISILALFCTLITSAYLWHMDRTYTDTTERHWCCHLPRDGELSGNKNRHIINYYYVYWVENNLPQWRLKIQQFTDCFYRLFARWRGNQTVFLVWNKRDIYIWIHSECFLIFEEWNFFNIEHATEIICILYDYLSADKYKEVYSLALKSLKTN